MQQDFDYHNIDRLKIFDGTHSKYMKERIERVNCKFEFDPLQKGFKKMKFKHKIGNIIEDITGVRIGEYKNFIKI